MQQTSPQKYLLSIAIDTGIDISQALSSFNSKYVRIQQLLLSIAHFHNQKQQTISKQTKQQGEGRDVMTVVRDLGKYMKDHPQQISQVIQTIPKISTILATLLTTSLQNNTKKGIEFRRECIGPLVQGLGVHQKLLQDYKVFQLYLALVYHEIYQIRVGGGQEKLVFFPHFVTSLQLLQKYIKSIDKEFQIIRILFHYGLELVVELQPKSSTEKLSYFIQNRTEFRFYNTLKKPTQTGPDTSTSDLERLYGVMRKYSMIDPHFKSNLLEQMYELFIKGIGCEYVFQLFKIIKQLMSKKIFEDLDKDVFHDLIRMAKSLNNTNIHQFKHIIEILLEKSDDKFLEENSEILLDFGINEELKIILFSVYYDFMNRNKDISNHIVNILVQWNAELCLVPVQKFMPEIVKEGIHKITPETQLILSRKLTPISIVMQDKIIQNKNKELFDFKNQVDTPLNLELFNKNQTIYSLYTKQFIQLLINIQAQKFKNNAPEMISIAQSIDVVRKVYDHGKKIFDRAMKHQIYSQDFLYYFALLTSIVEIKRITEIHKKNISQYYIKAVRGIKQSKIVSFARNLLPIFKIFKNSFILFLVLCCCLLSLKYSQQNSKSCLEILEEVIKIVDMKGFAKINGYHSQNIKALILLSFNKVLKNTSLKLIAFFSIMYNRTDVELIFYQFDKTLFQNFLNNLEIDFPDNFSNENFIFHALETVLAILEISNNPKCLYLGRSDNCINFIPIRHANHRNSLLISFKALINSKFCCNSAIDIYGSPRTQQPGGTQKHRLTFKNKKIMFYNRITKEKNGCIELSEEIQGRPIFISIQCANSKLIIYIHKEKLVEIDYDYMLDNIRFDLFGDMLIKQFKWSRLQNEEKQLKFNSHFQIFPSQAQIKISKILTYSIQNLSQKLDLVYFCTYLIEIMKNNHTAMDLNNFYNLCCQLLFHLPGTHKNQYTPPQYSCIRKLFRSILKYAQNKQIINILNVPYIPTQEGEVQNKNKKLYQILISTVFDENFLLQSSQKCQFTMLEYLEKLMENKKYNFKQTVISQENKIFTNICKAAMKAEGNLRSKTAELIKKIIFNHETNQCLLKKITVMFYLAESNSSQFLKKLFDSILASIFIIVTQTKTDENSHTQSLGKYILSSNKNLESIFLILSVQIKLRVLQFMINDTKLNLYCHQIFSDLQKDDLLELSNWIIVYCKKTMFDFFDANRKTQANLHNMVFLLKQISKVYGILQEQDEKEQCISILTMFMKKSKAIIDQTTYKQEIKQEIQSFFYCTNFIRIIEDKIEQCNENMKDLAKQGFLNNYFNIIFLHMPKKVILKALQQLRISEEHTKESCKFIFKLDCIDILPLHSLSAFLQYIIEILFTLRQTQNEAQSQELGLIINQYILKLLKHYSSIIKIKQPFFYAYPKLEKKIKFNETNAVKKAVQQVRKCKSYELRGGICFKIICITFHLMEILPKLDLSYYFSLFFGNLEEKKENLAVYRAVNDFIQVRKDTKNRSYIDGVMKEVQTDHRQYFQQNEEDASNNRNSVSGVRSNIDNDLTPFYVDFILMRIFLYLENHCNKDDIPDQQMKILKIYSNLALKYLKSCEIIWEEINERNTQSVINYQDVKDLTNLLENQKDVTISQMMQSPRSNCKRFNENNGLGFLEISKQDDANYLVPSTPSKIRKRASTINIDLTSGKKKKQMFSNIEENIFAWAEEAKLKKLHQYFRDEAKEIFLMELLHQLFVISTSLDASKDISPSKTKRLYMFLKDQEALFEQEQKAAEKSFKNKKDQLRMVYKYTCDFVPQLKLKCHAFPNNTFPFVSVLKHQKHPIAHRPREAIMNPDLAISILHAHNQQQLHTQTIISLQNTTQPEENTNICQISNRKGVYFCEWQMQETSVVFMTKNEKVASCKSMERYIKYGSPLCNIIPGNGKKIQLKISQILQVFYRKYNQIKNNSVEFFLKNGASLYIIFYTEELTNKFIELCKKKYRQFKQIKIVQNFVKQFQNENYTQKWAIGQISNFDYLLLINKYAGRTYSDLNQYYIFPWILTDYSSKSIDISDSKIYRDLKKPIGALNPQKLSRYLEKYHNENMQVGQKYLYGSHYSTSLFIFYYLVRLQPFTSLHKDMQSGVFDAPDRLFSSIKNMWECLLSQSSTSDIKQSIPEFYYFPTFLKNINKLNLGVKQSGAKVEDVQLPPWASSPTNFIHKMRICLQSDYVSMHLHHWIDLIFGKDQKQISKCNLFHPLSYVENINADSIDLGSLDAIMSQITFFGQNPYVLFSKQHPKKKIKIAGSSIHETLNLTLSQDLTASMRSLRDSSKNFAEENLDMINYVSDMKFKTKKVIEMTISGISKSSTKKVIELDMQSSIHSLIRTIQKIDHNTLKRLLSQNFIDVPEERTSIMTTINQTQVTFKVGTANISQVVKSIKFHFNFKHIKFNQTVIILYGNGPGLRIYDWNEEIIWDYTCNSGQISDCFLQYGLLFFTISVGKLFVYDFFYGSLEMIYQYQKSTYELNMLVYPQNKSITKRNQNTYKFLLVGDKRKIALLNYVHKIGKLPNLM